MLMRSKYKNPLLIAVIQKSNQNSYDCLKHLGLVEIEKPKCLKLYPEGAQEKDFYFLSVID